MNLNSPEPSKAKQPYIVNPRQSKNLNPETYTLNPKHPRVVFVDLFLEATSTFARPLVRQGAHHKTVSPEPSKSMIVVSRFFSIPRLSPTLNPKL